MFLGIKRAELFARLRADQTRGEALAQRPQDRWRVAKELIELSSKISPPPPAGAPGTDEPPELWLALSRRFRELGS